LSYSSLFLFCCIRGAGKIFKLLDLKNALHESDNLVIVEFPGIALAAKVVGTYLDDFIQVAFLDSELLFKLAGDNFPGLLKAVGFHKTSGRRLPTRSCW
jgi:hypothetical protein